MYSHNRSTVSPSQMDYLDVQNLAQTGEGTYLEFKRTIPSAYKIAREIAAFANTKGGTLLIGVDDDKSLVGVLGYQEEEYLLEKARRDICHPSIDITIEVVHFGERDLLVIRVPESEQKPIYVKDEEGDTVFMREKDKNKVASKELIEIIQKEIRMKGLRLNTARMSKNFFVT